jgi:hypothetical protein
LFLLVVLLLVGGWLGNLIGTLAGGVVPVLARSLSAGIEPPFKLAAEFFTLTFGLTLHLNLVGLVGLLLGLFAWSRF